MVEGLIDLEHENILGESRIKLNLGHSRQRAIYWRKIGDDWVQTQALPADPMSVAYYFSKGFRAKPPKDEVKKAIADRGNGKLVCDCGFVAKNAFGLLVHQRKHK